MKRRVLLKKIADQSLVVGVAFRLVREGGNHSIYECGDSAVVIPRHREVNEYTSEGIMKDLEPVLGERWWK